MSEGKVLGQIARMAPAAEPDAMETYRPGLTNLPKYTQLSTGEIVPVEQALGRTVNGAHINPDGSTSEAFKNIKAGQKPAVPEPSSSKLANISAPSVRIEKPFEINGNVQRISGMNARSVVDAIESTGHTLAESDLVELKGVNGKATEVDLYRGPRDSSKVPAGEKYHVIKYEGVGHEGKNSAFVRATDTDLAVIKESKTGMAGKERSAEENAHELLHSTIVKAADGTGNPRQYTQKIKWGENYIDARPDRKGFFGTRTRQSNLRVDAYERLINPDNESYYLPHPDGGYVQFENMVNNVVKDGKLIMDQRSYYHVYDMPDFAKKCVLKNAIRQIEAARDAGCSVEWLVSDYKAASQLTKLFREYNIDIVVTYLPE